MIKMFNVVMPRNVTAPLEQTLFSGYIAQGPKVEEFEQRLAGYLRTENVLTTNSCTAALTLALRLAGVGPGDEVVTTAMTCTATNLPIITAGAKPVFADVDPKTGNIDPESIEKRITKKTKAIMFVDWGGLPADLEEIDSIGRKHGIKVIQDAAHAFGATYDGDPVNQFTDFTCYSFQAIKHLTTGDGGALVCRDDEDYERGKKLRWFGIDRKTGKDTRINEDIEEAGYKFHMNDIAATIGIAQMDHIDRIIKRHRDIAMRYLNRLDPELCEINTSLNSGHWIFTVLLKNRKHRDAFRDYMADNGVQVSQVHRRNDEYTVFKPYGNKKLSGLDSFADRMICLPVHAGLTDEDVQYIISAANAFTYKPKRKKSTTKGKKK